MSTPRKKYESSRQRERQTHILASAREMLSEVGYGGTTMRALAERAGVVPATLYNLYGGKDELILAAVDDLLVALREQASASNPQPGIDAILILSKTMGQQILDTPSYAEAMARALFKVERDDPLVDILFARSLPFIEVQLGIAKDNHELLPGTNVPMVARHLVSQGWAVVWSWIMGLIELRQVPRERERSDLMTLVGVSQGATNQRLQQRLAELDS